MAFRFLSVFLIAICVLFLTTLVFGKHDDLFTSSDTNGLKTSSMNEQVKYLNRYKRGRLNSICPTSCTCKVLENNQKTVSCVGASKTYIPDTIPADATSVYLSNNAIEAIEKRPMTEISRVKRMDFSFNKIEKIELGAFKDLFRLQWLDLSHNPLGNISIFDLSESRRSLKTLNLSNTGLSGFPQLHHGNRLSFHNLETLVASKNNFTKLKAGAVPKNVRYLDLSCLKVRRLSGNGFKHLHLLSELVIRGCALENGIRSVQDGAFSNLKVLRRLDLSGNSLKALPRGLPESLLQLDLSNNQIPRIKGGSCASQEAILTQYRMGSNLEENDPGLAVGSDLSILRFLVDLNLSYNKISSLCPDDFLLMQQLKTLNLSNCNIQKSHPQTFLYAQSLTNIDLSNNLITDFEISELPDLEELYCQRNRIMSVKGVTKMGLPALRKADFSHNRFTCDCNLIPFLKFLGMSYGDDLLFRHLSATSSLYVCFKPSNLRDRSLMSVDISSEITCGGPTVPIPWPAIAAPISLAALFLLIALILIIQRRRAGKESCACCCQSKENIKKVTPTYRANDDCESDIEIQNNSINDLAILSHEENQNWVMTSLIPKLQRGSEMKKESSQNSSEENRSLKIEVFTIGKTIRIDTLHRCIDVNRKIAVIVTHEFLGEESCRYILKVVQERLLADPEDAVLCVLLDSIPKNKIIEPLQKLITEKTFLQFPVKDRERQEFYFWDKLNSLVFASSSKSERPWQNNGEEVVKSVRQSQRYQEEEQLKNDADTIRSSRRAPSIRLPINEARAARWQRLGITRDDDVTNFTPIDESKHQSLYPRPANNPPIEQAESKRAYDQHINKSESGTAFAIPRTSSKGLHSLLPPDHTDAESVYSDEGKEHLSHNVVRPLERHRSIVSSPQQTSINNKQAIKSSPDDENDTLENLHGTTLVKTISLPLEVARSRDETVSVEGKNLEEENSNKRNSSRLSRLKSFFLV